MPMYPLDFFDKVDADWRRRALLARTDRDSAAPLAQSHSAQGDAPVSLAPVFGKLPIA
jgi:hypothetical protein